VNTQGLLHWAGPNPTDGDGVVGIRDVFDWPHGQVWHKSLGKQWVLSIAI